MEKKAQEDNLSKLEERILYAIRIMLGVLLIVIGIISLLLPVIPGLILVIIGLLLIGNKKAKSLLLNIIRKVEKKQ